MQGKRERYVSFLVLCANFQITFAARVRRPTSKEHLGGGKIVRELWKEIGALQDAKKLQEFNLAA
jgi:hypothetical protein